ncbi:MAG: tetratricopeptide repeat protein [Myxococcota bacterium]
MSDDDNVIHVVFGSDGGHRLRAPVEPPRSEPSETVPPPPTDPHDPLADLYARAEVARLFDITESRLRYWDKTDFLKPSAKRGRRRFYTFQDLIGIRAAKGLLDAGLPLQEVRRSVDAIRKALPRVVRPLAELRVVAEGHAMLVRDEGGTYEPQTGQLVLDFKVEALKKDVVRVLRRTPSPTDRQHAYALYLEGCRLDEDESTMDEAERCYREALRLDPALSNALTNLGNLAFRQGDISKAETLYGQALAIDPEQPEALYNLGFLHTDRDDHKAAVGFFRRALASDPHFADAHFHLALAHEMLGEARQARPHWQRYLDLDPHGEWRDIAEEHLARSSS